MLTVYTWPTPNGHKIHIMLEECGFLLNRDWQAIPVNIGTGDQFPLESPKIQELDDVSLKCQLRMLANEAHPFREGKFIDLALRRAHRLGTMGDEHLKPLAIALN